MPDPKKPQRPAGKVPPGKQPVVKKVPPSQPPAAEANLPPEKVSKGRRKPPLTKLAALYLGSSVLLFILSIVLLINGVRGLMVKSSAGSALLLHDSNRIERVVSECESALSWDPNQHGIRLLLAKIKAESGDLAGAEKEYQELLARGYTEPAVYAGLGVCALRRADKEANAQAAIAAANQALKHFAGKSGAAECDVGAANALLLIALRSKDHAKLAEAKAAFERLAGTIVKAGAKTPKETYIDFYAGYGRALSAANVNLAQAGRNYRICEQYASRWVTAPANYLRVEQRRYLDLQTDMADFGARKDQIQAFISSVYNRWNTDPVHYGELKEPWVGYALAVSLLYAKNGDFKGFNDLLQQATGGGLDTFETRRLKAAVWSSVYDPGKRLDLTTVQTGPRAAFDAVLAHDQARIPENVPLRAAMYNNIAVTWEYVAWANNIDRTYQDARLYLKLALEAQPDLYEAARNMALLYGRLVKAQVAEVQMKKGLNRPDFDTVKTAEELEIYFRKAAEIAARTNDDSVRKDFEELRRFLGK